MRERSERQVFGYFQQVMASLLPVIYRCTNGFRTKVTVARAPK